MKNTSFDRKYRILISVVSLLVLLPVYVVAQYPNMPANEVVHGYTLFPFSFLNLLYIAVIGITLFYDMTKLAMGFKTAKVNVGYFIVLVIGLVGASLFILQSEGLLAHYYGNGTIYPATYFPVVIQLGHIGLVIGLIIKNSSRLTTRTA